MNIDDLLNNPNELQLDNGAMALHILQEFAHIHMTMNQMMTNQYQIIEMMQGVSKDEAYEKARELRNKENERLRKYTEEMLHVAIRSVFK